jgi:hypothetical protein
LVIFKKVLKNGKLVKGKDVPPGFIMIAFLSKKTGRVLKNSLDILSK